MMFFSSIKTEPIPERVFSISHIVADKSPLDEKELEDILIPTELNTAKGSYFRPVLDAAKELGLVGYDEDNKVVFTGNLNDIKSLHEFRRFCNSKVFSNSSTDFYRIIACFLNSNDEWLEYSSLSTSDEIIRSVVKETDLPSNYLEKTGLLGIRFWLSFLGFGYIQENEKKKVFLPNMYTALRDFMALGDIEKGHEYSIEDFLNNLHSGSTVALKDAKVTQRLNLALSNALRLMHDNKEVELKFHLDSEKTWHLFPNEEHKFTSDITHIVIKKAVK